MGQQSILGPSRRASPRVSSRTIALALSIFVFASAGISQTIATTVPLILPSSVAFDSQGNLYIAETAKHVIYKVDVTGQISRVAGTGTQGFSGDGGTATQAQLDSPQGLALDSSNHLYITDTHNNRVRRLDLAAGLITTVAGGDAGFSGDHGPATAASLNQPTAIAIDSGGAIYVADSLNHRIRRIDSTGIITTIAGNGMQGFSGDGSPAASATLDAPRGLSIDTVVNLYIADTHNNRIRKVDSQTGLISTIAGTGALGDGGDGALAVNAALALPHGLAMDKDGNLYIADTANNRVRCINMKTGVITTTVGNGVQGFSGDAGPATQAALNVPRSAAISPSNLLAMADTGNQRVRQLSTDASLSTIAGLGATTPGALALSGPAITSYGSGRLTATLTTPTNAGGVVTFFDTTSSGSAAVSSVNVASNTASLDLSTFPAGIHNFSATYAGDQAHSSAQSSSIAVSITPLQINVTVTPSTLLYGQPVPALTGIPSGVLARDAANITANFNTTASSLSPVGSYPITATLSGSAAANYTLGAVPALTITPASTRTTLAVSSMTADITQSVTVTAHVLSTTRGNPSGTVALLDGGIPQLTRSVTSTGDVTFTVASFTPGAHNLSAVYSGDTNFKSSASSTYLLTVTSGGTSAPDFSLTSSGAGSQSASPGMSVNFAFTAQVQGAASLSSPITLAVSGLPQFATASFNPTFIPPGETTTPFTLTINIPKSNLHRSGLPSTPFVLAVLFLPLFRGQRDRTRACLFGIAMLVACATLSGCGDRVYTGDQSASGTKSYTITVTGTASSPSGAVVQHSVDATLILQQN